jgi:hypothetical protein
MPLNLFLSLEIRQLDDEREPDNTATREPGTPHETAGDNRDDPLSLMVVPTVYILG